jgi:hypothetical protein
MKPMTAETRAKISAAMKGHIRSAEARVKSSIALKGVKKGPPSAEHRAKIGAAHRGRIGSKGVKLGPPSAEHRAKIGAALRGRSVKGEIMTPWGKFNSSTMARECGLMLGIKNTRGKVRLGLKEDPENYYYIKDTK